MKKETDPKKKKKWVPFLQFGNTRVSIQAGFGNYSEPETDDAQEYKEVEICFSTKRPPRYISEYSDSPGEETYFSVYAYVPIEKVARWIKEEGRGAIEEADNQEILDEPDSYLRDGDPAFFDMPEEEREFISNSLKEQILQGERRSIEEGDIVLTLENPYAGIARTVMWVEGGSAHVKSGNDVEIIPENRLFHVADFIHADILYKKYFTKELDHMNVIEVTPPDQEADDTKSYDDIKKRIEDDLKSVPDEDLQYFLQTIDEDDYLLAGKAHKELLKRRNI